MLVTIVMMLRLVICSAMTVQCEPSRKKRSTVKTQMIYRFVLNYGILFLVKYYTTPRLSILLLKHSPIVSSNGLILIDQHFYLLYTSSVKLTDAS